MRSTLFFFVLLFIPSAFIHGSDVRNYSDETKKERVSEPSRSVIEDIFTPVIGRELSRLLALPVKIFPAERFTLGEADHSGQEITVATGTGKRRMTDIPAFGSVITREDIENSNARHAYDLLRREPGIYVRDYAGAGKTVSVDMRGFGESASSNTLVLVDGRRINEIDISGTDWGQIPVENIERIEVLKGAGSVIYGDNAAAGVINIITKRGRTGHHFHGGAEFGSYKHRAFHAGGYGGTEKIAYSGFYKHAASSGYRLNSDLTLDTLQGALSFYPSDQFTFEVSGGWHRDWYGMPGPLSRTQIDRLGRRGSNTPNNGAKTESAYIQADNAVFFLNDWLFEKELSLFTSFWGRKQRNNSNFRWFDNWFFLDWVEDRMVSYTHSWGLSQKFVVDNEWRNIKSSQTFGYDIFSAENKIMNHSLNPAWPGYSELKISKDTFGIFWDQKIEIADKFIISSGIRREKAWYVFDASSQGDYGEKKPSKTAFEAGIGYKYLPEGMVYGRFSRSFRFPATDEFYSVWAGLNREIEAQRSDTWEVGIKDRNWKYMMPGVNFFYMDTKNEIFLEPVSLSNANYARTERYGIEVAFATRPFDGVDGYLSYTWLDTRISKGLYSGSRVPMVPEHKLAFGLNWTLFECDGTKLTINYDAEMTGSRFSISDQSNTLPKNKKYFVNNLKATLDVAGLSVFFGCNNLFDEQYSEWSALNMAGDTDNYYPSAGRNFYLGISYRI